MIGSRRAALLQYSMKTPRFFYYTRNQSVFVVF